MTEHSNPTPATPLKRLRAAFGALPLSALLRWGGRALLAFAALWVLVALALTLAWNFWLQPRLPEVKARLAAELGALIGRPLTIGTLSASWQALEPTLAVGDIRIRNADGSDLRVGEVALTPSWSSLWHWQPRFASIRVQGLELALTRARDGKLSLNGIPLSGEGGKGEGERVVNWLIAQPSIVVDAKRLAWHDLQVGVGPLTVSDTRLTLKDTLLGHRLRLEGRPDSRFLGSFLFTLSWRGDELSRWREWMGDAQLVARDGRFGWWERYAPELPLARRGRASVDMRAAFAGGELTVLAGTALLEQAALAGQGGEQLALPKVAGRIDYRLEGNGEHVLAADQLYLTTSRGPLFENSRLSARWGTQGGEASASGLDLAPLLPVLIAARLLPEKPWSTAALTGNLSELAAYWQGKPSAPQGYRVSGRFSDLGWHTVGALPGVAGGFSGRVAFSDQGGSVVLAGRDVTVSAPEIFERPWQLLRADGEVSWQKQGNAWQVKLPGLKLVTGDFEGEVGGTLGVQSGGALLADFKARVPEVALTRVERYLPRELGEETLLWLREALLGGQGREVEAVLQGDLNAFPFAKGEGGRFALNAKIVDGALRFEPDWPAIGKIDGRLELLNDNVTVRAKSAQSAGAALADVVVRLPDLATQDARLDIAGRVDAPLSTMLAYTVKSPVNGYLDGFLGEISATGQAKLGLKLDIPLEAPENTRVKGTLALAGNDLRFTGLPIPPVTRAKGELVFTEYGVDIAGMSAEVFGAAQRLSARSTPDGVSRFAIRGEADTRRLVGYYLPPLERFVGGVSPIDIDFTLKDGDLVSLLAKSPLTGTRIDVPPPAFKAADARWPLALSIKPVREDLEIDWSLEGHAAGVVRLDGRGDLKGASVGVGRAPPALPAHGLAVGVAAPALDASAWLARLGGAGGAASHAGPSLPPWPVSVDVRTANIVAGGKPLGAVDFSTLVDAHGAHGDVDSALLAGRYRYDAQAAALQLDLDRLKLPLPELGGAGATPARLPAQLVRLVDVKIANVYYKQLDLGRLNARLSALSGQLRLGSASLVSPAGAIELTGTGLAPDAGRFALAVRSADIGALLTRFGMPGAVSGGQGALTGELGWPGALGDFSVEKLSGNLRLDVKDGRFAGYDPSVARLLSVLSLQSVGKLLRLDFAGVFDRGFAFDSIKGNIAVNDGVFATESLQLKSVPATVAIAGKVNLKTDTQALTVTVTPRLSQGVALAAGAAMLNPIAGIATLAAETILGNPFDKVFRSVYKVSGPIADPRVERVESALARPK
ncbi:YhdP family protein [Crenobacter intestini]|uniref:YhdP family protein n=1 Tax=Crenobacter intestini TaxID=2563443 RepID=UPI0014585187|nr:YhdP family protein [Crenobacter intestini]